MPPPTRRQRATSAPGLGHLKGANAALSPKSVARPHATVSNPKSNYTSPSIRTGTGPHPTMRAGGAVSGAKSVRVRKP